MQTDEEGFWYPLINTGGGCINCNLCNKVCPIENAESINRNIPEKVQTYIGYVLDEKLRLQSSSGGIFTVLAEAVLSLGGVVFGAAFDDDFLVHHIKVENCDDLEKLRGSKYLQSRIENTYREAEEELKQGRFVLFSGTACQIAGLYGYLQRDYENLYTVDVLCHGVPSPKVWRKYLDEQETAYGAAVRRTFFRSKKHGWKTYALSLEFFNDKAYEKVSSNDFFLQIFLRNICLRPSCHDCKFKGMDRPSDITIGDAWGVGKYSPDMDDDKGTSVLLTHTVKGEELLQKILPHLHYQKAELDTALPPQADSRKSVAPHPKRKKFFRALNRGASIKQLVYLSNPSFVRRVLRRAKHTVKKLLGK